LKGSHKNKEIKSKQNKQQRNKHITFGSSHLDLASETFNPRATQEVTGIVLVNPPIETLENSVYF
jgi:hypothetical protein